MDTLRLVFAYLRDRALSATLNVALMALGVATAAGLLLVSHQTEARLDRDARGVDMVVGAKGSPLQLILSSIYHADVPVGNIPLTAVEAVRADRYVENVIPIALGDNFRGYRVVGAPHDYVALYGGELAEGRLWDGALEAVFGATARDRVGVAVGDRIVVSHGLAEGGVGHENAQLEVVGVLEPTGTVIDRLVLTAIESVWLAHGQSADDPLDTLEVTAVLANFRSPLAAATLADRIDDDTQMMTASVPQEIARLRVLIGTGLDAMRAFAWVLIGAAGAGVFVTLFSAMRERAADIALMRVMGATQVRVFAQVLVEALTTAVIGVVLGLALAHIGVEVFGQSADQARDAAITGWTVAPGEALVAAAALGVALAAAALPAIAAYRVDLMRTLVR